MAWIRILGALCAALAPTGALAGLDICNDTDAHQSIAVAYQQEGTWVSEGWWNLDPDACARPLGDDLDRRIYFVYAEAPGWVFDASGRDFCIRDAEFTYAGPGDCAEDGYDAVPFQEIDIGRNMPEFVVWLSYYTEPAANAAQD